MKKITRLTGNIRLVGQAEKDGIAFQAEKFSGPFGVSPQGTLATAEDSDNIICRPWDKSVSPIHAKIAKLSKTALTTTGILAILFMLAHFTISILSGTYHAIWFYLSYIMISAVWLNEALGIFVARIFGNEEIKSFSKFLAAKNAVQNAYYHLGKIPSIQEAQMYSSFSYSSNYISRGNATISTWWLASALAHTLPFPWEILVLLVMLLVIFFLGKKDLLFFWQFLIVSKPEDIHYKVAITALEECLKPLDFIEIHVVSVTEEELLKDLGLENRDDCMVCQENSKPQSE